MEKIGFIGWRGMVGSVLVERIITEKDFSPNEYQSLTLFSTSQAGQSTSVFPETTHVLKDAYDFDALAHMDILVSCQGGDYTKAIHPQLRKRGWDGYWIDAASTLRMTAESVLILDPVNYPIIERGLNDGKKDFIGSNCTVSVMLMGIGSLLKHDLVEWVSNMTYQSASGGGAQNMLELIEQMGFLGDVRKHFGEHISGSDILKLGQDLTTAMTESDFPKAIWKYPLAGSIIPWVDSEVERGQSREEYKGMVETNKIMGFNPSQVVVDGTCVRVPVLRCHSEALTIKLKRNIPIGEIEALIKADHKWIRFVDNQKESTSSTLTPAAISGNLEIGVGRVRKLLMGEEYLNIFCIGDQLLWGAAEPLRRMISILRGRKLDS